MKTMRYIKSTVLPVFAATLWISISEFVRNEFLLKSLWIKHFEQLGMVFPDKAVNGAIWGIWSLCFAIVIFVLSKKFTLVQTALLSWFIGFLLMWLVIGNLGVLPLGILIFAIPLSILEAFVAVFLVRKFSGK